MSLVFCFPDPEYETSSLLLCTGALTAGVAGNRKEKKIWTSRKISYEQWGCLARCSRLLFFFFISLSVPLLHTIDQYLAHSLLIYLIIISLILSLSPLILTLLTLLLTFPLMFCSFSHTLLHILIVISPPLFLTCHLSYLSCTLSLTIVFHYLSPTYSFSFSCSMCVFVCVYLASPTINLFLCSIMILLYSPYPCSCHSVMCDWLSSPKLVFVIIVSRFWVGNF